MIYVTHDQIEAMTMGDRIAVLYDGIVQQHDTPLNLYNDPDNLFVAGFIGSPAMNFVEGKIENSQIVIENIKIDIGKKIQTDKVIIGIRPEYFTIDEQNPHFLAEIEVIEPMGNEIFLYFELAGEQIVARASASHPVKVGDKTPFRMDVQNIKLFDAKTEKRIRI